MLDTLYEKLRRLKLKYSRAENVFTDIYKKRHWKGVDSVSGSGSDMEQTQELIQQLPGILKELGVRSILDIPCGDFHWMKEVDLSDVEYIGGDIVSDLIERNNSQYKNNRVQFQKVNLLEDQLPKVDLIFCRDCLVHFSSADVKRAIQNIKRSNATYLAATTFPDRSSNKEIITGEWRPLNLEIAPFEFPKPTILLNEKCTQGNGTFADKSIGIWSIDQLA